MTRTIIGLIAATMLVGSGGQWSRFGAENGSVSGAIEAGCQPCSPCRTSVDAAAEPGAGGCVAALFGPPTICFPIDIGDGVSLPWSEEGKAVEYDPFRRVEAAGGGETAGIITDTLAILDKEPSALVRMETLRRATFYANGMRTKGKAPEWVADRLMGEVLARALDREAADDDDKATVEKGMADAWLDAAWLRACYGDLREHAATRQYDWLIRGMILNGSKNPDFDFAAAVLTMHAKALGRDRLEMFHSGHVKRAAVGAKEGSLLAKNLLARFGGEGATLAKLRGE